MADQRNGLPLFGLEGDVLQHIFPFFVGEANVLEAHVTLVTVIFFSHNIDALFIQQLEYAVSRHERSLQIRQLIHDTYHRMEHPVEVIDEGVEHTHGNQCIQRAAAHVPDQSEEEQVPHHVHQIMRGQGVQAEQFILVVRIFLVQNFKFFGRFLLPAKSTNDRHPLNRLIDHAVDRANALPDFVIDRGSVLPINDNPCHQQRDNRQCEEGQAVVQYENSCDNTNDIDRTCKKVRQHLHIQIPNGFGVIRDS